MLKLLRTSKSLSSHRVRRMHLSQINNASSFDSGSTRRRRTGSPVVVPSASANSATLNLKKNLLATAEVTL